MPINLVLINLFCVIQVISSGGGELVALLVLFGVISEEF